MVMYIYKHPPIIIKKNNPMDIYLKNLVCGYTENSSVVRYLEIIYIILIPLEEKLIAADGAELQLLLKIKPNTMDIDTEVGVGLIKQIKSI